MALQAAELALQAASAEVDRLAILRDQAAAGPSGCNPLPRADRRR